MSGIRITNDTITPALGRLTAALKDVRMIFGVAADARTAIVSRTLSGISLSGSMFPGYASGGTFYAPVKNRPPGYPSPKGGRTKALRGGRKLKTHAYGGGYGEYKAAQGLGGSPQLSVSNEMLGDIQIQVLGPRRAELFFGDRLSAVKAHRHHFGKFPFFGVTPSEQENLPAAILENLRRQGAIT
jgi:hypothetical protein